MALLNEQDRQYLIEEFATLQQPVKLVLFTQEFECQYCRETRQLAEDVAALSEKISLNVYDFVADKTLAEQYQVDKIPAILILENGATRKDYGIRYYGVPAGYEFSSFIHDILMVGKGDSGLTAETRQWLAQLKMPLHLQVFVTPSCPYCPAAVSLAHRLAMESDLVTADMVEAAEFPHLTLKYQVMGVPRTVINETNYLEGAVPEKMLLAKLQQIASSSQ